MKAYQTIVVEEAKGVATVYLNRPKFNLFNGQMIDDLTDFFHSLRNNREIRFMILTAKGDHFTAGADLGEFKGALTDKARAAENLRINQLNGQEMLRSLEALEQITIAALRGVVVGAGMTLSTACDFRIMSENSHFSVPETKIGFYYTWGSTPRLVELVGVSKAMEIILICDPIPAQEAHKLGLVNRVVPDDQLMKATHEFIEQIAARGPVAVRMTKKLAMGAAMRGFGNMFIPETELVEGLEHSGEPMEGIKAFLEKRPPKYNK